MRVIIALFVMLFPFSSGAQTYQGNTNLVLMGEGRVHYLGFIKVYDARLYAPEGSVKEDIMTAGTSYCLELSYHVALTPANFVEAAYSVLKRQHSPAYLDSMRGRINLLHNTYQAVKKGDRYAFYYDSSNNSTTLRLNDKDLVRVPGRDFASLYGGIWLGQKKPLDSDLRDNLLGRARKKE